MDQEDQKLILQELFIGQREVSKKLDELNTYMRGHAEKDEHEFGKINAHIATLKTQVGGHSKQWGAIQTVVTSILSALGVAYFVGRSH